MVKKVHGYGVPTDVRADLLPFEGRATPLGQMGVFGEEALDRISAESAAADAGKDWILGLTVAFAEPGAYHPCRSWTQWRATQLSAFPETAHVGPPPQHNVVVVQSDQLRNPQTGLDRDQDKGSIATPYPGGSIRNSEQGIDLFSVEKFDRFSYVALIGHRQDPLTMQGLRGLLQSHVPEKRVDGSQPNNPRASAVFASAFQVIEEETNEGSIEVFEAEMGGAFVEPFLGELQKQTKGIAISCYRMRACLPLTKQTIGEKRLKKRGEAGGHHGCTSR